MKLEIDALTLIKDACLKRFWSFFEINSCGKATEKKYSKYVLFLFSLRLCLIVWLAIQGFLVYLNNDMDTLTKTSSS